MMEAGQVRRVRLYPRTLTAVGTFTKVTQTAADTFAADATSAEEEAIYVIIVDPAKLDVDNGFDCIRANIADVGGNAQLGCVLYLLFGARYGQQPLISAIAD